MTDTRQGGEPAPTAQAGADVLVRAHAWVLEHWPKSVRQRIAVVFVVVALGATGISTVARLIGAAVDAGVLAYVGLMVVCWVGAGGALVPVPGIRPLSWVMVVHQSTALFPPVVVGAAALAMVLGQSSYFVAVQIEERWRREGHGPRAHGGLILEATSGSAASEASAASDATTPKGIVARSRALLDAGRAAVARRMATHPQRILFLLCVLPNPLTTFATVSAASSKVPFARFFAASLAGFLVLTAALVIAGQGLLAALGID